MDESLKTGSLLDLEKTIASSVFDGCEYPWEILPRLSKFIAALGKTLPEDEYERREGDVYISKTARIAPTASISGPCIIDHDAEIRHCAFIRGSAVIGKGAVVGNSTEIKNSLLFDKAQAPHFNYVGDSVLGCKAHMGAGAVTSNVKSDKSLVVVHASREIETSLKKFGAILGDNVEVGCNSVLNPGTVLGRSATVYPTSCVRGVVPADSIYKRPGCIVHKD